MPTSRSRADRAEPDELADPALTPHRPRGDRQTLDFPVCQQFFPGVASVRRSSLASKRFKCATEGTGYAAKDMEAWLGFSETARERNQSRALRALLERLVE